MTKHEYKGVREPAEGIVHDGIENPHFEDRYYRVELDSHESVRNRRRDGIELTARDFGFDCRVGCWKFGSDKTDAPKLRFLMIAGIAHSCHFFNPLVKCMSIDEIFEGFAVEVYSIDIPGHGASHIPPNIKFGMLRLEDYVDVIMQIMEKLQTDEKVESFEYIVAHSMGGMLAMMLEEALASSGERKNLRERYGTKGIVLLASALPEKIDWSLGEGKISEYGVPVNLLKLLLPYVTFSPRYLLHGRISNEDFVNTFFAVVEKDREKDRMPKLRIVPGAPVGDAVTLINSGESYVALSELGGLDLETGGVLKRPDIKKGLFSDYTLGVAGYAKDILFTPAEELALFEYLSSNRRRIYKPIEHEHAVHDDPYSYPCASFQLLAEIVALSNT